MKHITGLYFPNYTSNGVMYHSIQNDKGNISELWSNNPLTEGEIQEALEYIDIQEDEKNLLYEVWKINDVFGVYNQFMKLVKEYVDMDDFIKNNELPHDRFLDFNFPVTHESEYYDDSFSLDDFEYTGKRYNPHYDGPYHYIPWGNH